MVFSTTLILVVTLALLLVVSTCGLPEVYGDHEANTTASSIMNDHEHHRLMMERFHRWMEAYGRSYATVNEKMQRFKIYRRNMEFIDKVNQDESLTYELGETSFTDLTDDEFRARYTGGVQLPPDEDVVGSQNLMISTGAEEVPDSVDWEAKGCVTPVKDEKNCGACWAFAAVAAIESVHKISGGDLVRLSEQELVDCDGSNDGCREGNPYKAFRWVWENSGIAPESAYPYIGAESKCITEKLELHAATLGSYCHVPMNREDLVKVAVASRPVAILFKADVTHLHHYRGGVFNGPCAAMYNHSMAIVGYGRQPDKNKLYWKAKNSWGPDWGLGGYILLERDIKDLAGTCGLATWPSYPTSEASPNCDPLSHASA